MLDHGTLLVRGAADAADDPTRSVIQPIYPSTTYARDDLAFIEAALTMSSASRASMREECSPYTTAKWHDTVSIDLHTESSSYSQ